MTCVNSSCTDLKMTTSIILMLPAADVSYALHYIWQHACRTVQGVKRIGHMHMLPCQLYLRDKTHVLTDTQSVKQCVDAVLLACVHCATTV